MNGHFLSYSTAMTYGPPSKNLCISIKKKSNIHNYRNGDIAAYYGYLELLKNNNDLVFTETAMDWAAENGHLKVIKWLHTNRSEGCTVDAMNWAASTGQLEVIKWLHINRSEGCIASAINRAAINNHLDVINWLNSYSN